MEFRRVLFRSRDGFCPISTVMAAPEFDPATSSLAVLADGQLVFQGDFSHFVRDLPQLMQDVTEFMTLNPGDVLMLGLLEGAPIVGKTASIHIEVDGLGVLRHSVEIESGVTA